MSYMESVTRRRPPARSLTWLSSMGRLRLLAPLAAIVIAGCGSSSHSATRSSSRGTSGATGTSAPAGTSSPSTPQTAASERCTPQQLRLAYLGSQGATGHIEASFQLRNGSQKPCTLFGYPGAQMLDAKGNNLPTHVQRGGAFFADTRRAPHNVLLAPQQSARFVFGYSTNPEYGSGTTSAPKPCPAAVKLEVTPPNTYSQLVVSMFPRDNFAPCGGVLVAGPVN
jgi:Protein of unknown function (DUF4232)